MNTKRSYLDSLNKGRARRSYTSLEDLNRSLENLEQRLERNQADARAETAADRSWPPAATRGDQKPAPESSYRALAHDMERVKGQEDGFQAVGRIVEELHSLRDELRNQMTAGLQREFDSLRDEIGKAAAHPGHGREGAEIGAEFERLSHAIHDLSQRSDDRGIGLLRQELEQVKGTVDSLAREETVRSVDARFHDLDRRWSSLEDRLAADRARPADDPEIAALHARLEHISNAVGNLPESLSLQSLEEKVRMLAAAVDHLSRQEDRRGRDAMAQIEERLDEISRAIVATASTIQQPSFDPQPFERIEARITSLARQIEELVEDEPNAEVLERLGVLSARVDDLAARADLPEQAVERLARQVAVIVDKLDQAPVDIVSGPLLEGIEQRFDMLADVLDRRQNDALQHGQALFRDLERRLDDVAARLDERPSAADTAGIMDEIDRRFTDFARRLDDTSGGVPDDTVIRHLAARLDSISDRLDASAEQLAGIDPALIRNLEAQVSGLTEYLARPSATMPELEDLGPRLDDIERSLADQRSAILDAARHAAEDAVRAFGPAGSEPSAMVGLVDDFKALETLTRRSDERNAKTFEAIHDTLLKIVDRLAATEFLPAAAGAEPRRALDSTPPIDAADTEGVDPMDADADEPGAGRGGQPSVALTPAEAAAAAAVAAMSSEAPLPVENPRRVRSLLGGLTRAFSGKKDEQTATVEAEPAVEAPPSAPQVELDEPFDPKAANRPLEPGSAPDLGAIMQRVRDERGAPSKGAEGDAAKSDFIAAARRAAQAAAADVDIPKPAAEGEGSAGRLKVGGLFRRKTVLLSATAIIVALAGMQLGKAFLAEDRELAANRAADRPVEAVPSEPMQAAVAPAGATDEPAAARVAEQSAPMTAEDEAPSAADDERRHPETAGLTIAPGAEDAEPMEDTAALTDAPPASGAGAEDADLEPMPATPTPPPVAHAQPAEPATAAPATTAISVPGDAGPAPLREAASGGDPKALYEIGMRFADGRGVKADPKKAAEWYEKAAELGLAPAQYRIGNFYEKGTGVDSRRQEGQDLVPDGRRAGQRQRHAQSGGAVRDGHRRRRRQPVGRPLVQRGRRDGRQGQPVQPGHPRRQGRRHAAGPRGVLQMVRAGGQGRRQGRRRQARRGRQGAEAGPAGKGARRHPVVEGQAGQRRDQPRRDPGLLAGGQRDDGRRRHEEGRAEHPAHPQQERLRRRRRRWRDGRQDQDGDRQVPDRQRARGHRRGQREAGPRAARQEIAARLAGAVGRRHTSPWKCC